jgi:hypothetical protein
MTGVNTGRPLRVTSTSSGEYENRLLDGITAPTGVRTTPNKQGLSTCLSALFLFVFSVPSFFSPDLCVRPSELKEFVDKARSLDAVLVSQLLQKRFSASAYQTQLVTTSLSSYLFPSSHSFPPLFSLLTESAVCVGSVNSSGL